MPVLCLSQHTSPDDVPWPPSQSRDVYTSPFLLNSPRSRMAPTTAPNGAFGSLRTWAITFRELDMLDEAACDDYIDTRCSDF